MSDRCLAIGLFSTERLGPAPSEFAGQPVRDVDAYEHGDSFARVACLDVDPVLNKTCFDELRTMGKALDGLGASCGAVVAIMDPYFNLDAPPPWATPNWPDAWTLGVGLYDYVLLSVRCELAWLRQAEALDITDTMFRALDRSFRLIPAAHGVLFRAR